MIKWKLTFKINRNAPKVIKNAVMNWLVAASLVPEKNAKVMTTEEEHIITWRFRASINLNSKDWIPRSTVSETKKNDWIHEEQKEKLKLIFWTNVEYAAFLERKYSILWRSLDMSKWAMNAQFARGVKAYLDKQ